MATVESWYDAPWAFPIRFRLVVGDKIIIIS